MASALITITLPPETVEEIARFESNRSRFVLEAIRRELQRRRREELRQSLRTPHPESDRVAEEGFEAWGRSWSADAKEDLVDPRAGTPIRWTPGKGWTERKR